MPRCYRHWLNYWFGILVYLLLNGCSPTGFVIGFAPGSELDRSARIVASRMQRDLADMKIENVPGSESLAAANYIYNGAQPGGSTVGVFSGDRKLWQEHMSGGRIRFDPQKFEWIGGLEDHAARLLFFALPPGTPKVHVERLREVFKTSTEDPQVKRRIFKTLGAEEVDKLVAAWKE